MVNILWKRNTAGILVLILLAAGSITLLVIPNFKLGIAQSNRSNDNFSTGEIPAITHSPPETESKSSMIGPFATSSNVSALQSNNIENTRAAYDIIFKTGSAGDIKNVEMTFPSGTNIRNATILEVSGIGRGATTINGQTLIYTVTSPVNVPLNRFLRFEVWNIVNPLIPNSNLAVQVTTKNSVGGEIDSGTSALYSIKQITTGDITNNAILGSHIRDGQVGTSDIAGNSITSSKLADSVVTTSKIVIDAVTADKIAGVTKLIFGSCDGNPTHIGPNEIITVQCLIPGASLQDNVVVTSPFICPFIDSNQNPHVPCLETLGGRVSNADEVSIYILNNIFPQNPINTGQMKFSIIVFKP